MSQKIKSSNNGVPYATPKILYQGQRVYSQAILMKINHNNESKIDIGLKIGRYYVRNRKPELNTPKSELTLKNSELEALVKYISDNYTPLTLGQGEYISVDSNQSELIEQFKSILQNSEETAKTLVESEILTKDVYYAVNFINKKKSLEEFEYMLREDLPESSWQDWFEYNKWILGSDFARIVDERNIDTHNIADYIMQSYDGFVDIVEIKKPNEMPFWALSKDHNNYIPSSTLTKAITQCLNYIYSVEQKTNDASFRDQIGCKVVKPRCTLIYGRSYDWDDEKQKAFRILNSAYSQITILTYDQLLARAKNILGITEDEFEENVYEEDDLPF
ncbi:MAG: DUF4263 domain-containing protein [Eubacterium sp.]|nr:DUF4263 domain-containing protein [Eubacterium sp.]